MVVKSEPIRVLHCIDAVNLGGGARALRTLGRYFPEYIQTHVIVIYSKGPKYQELADIFPNVLFVDGDAQKIIEYVQNHGIKVIQLYGRGVFSEYEKRLVRSLKSTCKIVYTNIFGEFDYETKTLTDKMVFKSMHAFVVKFAKAADVRVQSSQNWESTYCVVPNPIDIKHFEDIRPSSEEILAFKSSLNISPDDHIIGKIGARKAIEKWSDILLYMFPLVLQRRPDVILLLQGTPLSRIGWVKKFGDRVRILPETTDDKQLAVMYGSLDIFTHASKIGEHSGNSVNEAMFWKKPVIVNITPNKDNGQLEQVDHERTGFFANTPDVYARRVLELLDDKVKREKFGEAGHQFVVRHNNPQIIAQEYASLYQSVISGRYTELSVTAETIRNYDKVYKDNVAFYINAAGGSLPSKYKLSHLYWKIKDIIDHKVSEWRLRK